MSNDEIRQSAEQGHCSAYHTLMLLKQIDVLTEALEAQMKVSEQMMRHANFSGQDILNCTAQAWRALAIVSGR